MDDLEAKLQTTQQDLKLAQEQIFELASQVLDLKRNLKREQLINTIAFSYIPEDQHNRYYLDLPNHQPTDY
jgi:hypothetical protein